MCLPLPDQSLGQEDPLEEEWQHTPVFFPGKIPRIAEPGGIQSAAVAAAAAKLLQSCPTLCDRIDSSPPGSAVPGILQARTLEWVAISFSNA